MILVILQVLSSLPSKCYHVYSSGSNSILDLRKQYQEYSQLLDQKRLLDIHKLTTTMNMMNYEDSPTNPSHPAGDSIVRCGYGMHVAEYRGK